MLRLRSISALLLKASFFSYNYSAIHDFYIFTPTLSLLLVLSSEGTTVESLNE